MLELCKHWANPNGASSSHGLDKYRSQYEPSSGFHWMSYSYPFPSNQAQTCLQASRSLPGYALRLVRIGLLDQIWAVDNEESRPEMAALRLFPYAKIFDKALVLQTWIRVAARICRNLSV